MFDLFFLLILIICILIILPVQAIRVAKAAKQDLANFKKDIIHALSKVDNQDIFKDILQGLKPTEKQQDAFDWPYEPKKFEQKAKTEELRPENPQTKKTEDQSAQTLKRKSFWKRFEDNFARRSSIWLGGIALAIGGVFLVKQTIEAGLLTPEVRIIIGIVFSVLLIVAGEYVNQKPDTFGDDRLKQSLFGAGSVVLFGIIYASASLYGFIDTPIAFSLMVAVMVGTIVRSIVHGMPIALLGLVGAFVTPLLLKTETPNVTHLFSYLIMIVGASLWIMRRQNWIFLLWPLLVFTFGWPVLWMISQGFSTIVSLFSLVSMAGIFFVLPSLSFSKAQRLAKPIIMNTVLIAAASILFTTLYNNHFDLLDWALIVVLVVGVLIVSALRDHEDNLRYMPWSLLVFTSLALYTQTSLTGFKIDAPTFDPMIALLLLLGFTAIYGFMSLFFVRFTKKPSRYAALYSLSTLIHFGVAKLTFHGKAENPSDFTWCWIALGFAFVSLEILRKIYSNAWHLLTESTKTKDTTLFIFTATTTAFVSIALANLLDYHFWPLAFAIQTVFLTLIVQKFPLPVVNRLYTILLIGSLLAASYDYIPVFLYLSGTYDLSLGAQWSDVIMKLVIPVILFNLCLFTIPKEKLKSSNKVFYYISLLCIPAVAISLYGKLFNSLSFSEDAAFYHKLAKYAMGGFLGCIAYLMATYERVLNFDKHVYVAKTICIFSVTYILFANLLIYNPYFSSISLGDKLIFNSLLLLYAVPLVVLYGLYKRLVFSSFVKQIQVGISVGILGVLLFQFINTSIAHFWRGSTIYSMPVSFAESLTYSLTWISIAIGVLVYGIGKKNLMFRYTGLGTMTAVICKIAFYDTFELDGFYRAIVYIILGLSLIGIGYLYQRFVVAEKKQTIEN